MNTSDCNSELLIRQIIIIFFLLTRAVNFAIGPFNVGTTILLFIWCAVSLASPLSVGYIQLKALRQYSGRKHHAAMRSMFRQSVFLYNRICPYDKLWHTKLLLFEFLFCNPFSSGSVYIVLLIAL